MVPKGGIEPPTRGPSNRRSTPELLRLWMWRWLQWPGSNRRPEPYEDPALTPELHCTGRQCARTLRLQMKDGIRAVVKSSWRVMGGGG